MLYATQGACKRRQGKHAWSAIVPPSRRPCTIFGELWGLLETWDPAQASEWRPVDADMAYTVTTQIDMPEGHSANALFRGSVQATAPPA